MEALRAQWRDFLWRKKTQTLITFDEGFFQHSAIIFSPHQDDETLGCGGLIAKKRNSGALVKTVMMTDGSRSHSQFISVDELIQLRAGESFAAAEILGMDRQDVIHLGFPDGRLSEYAEDAVQKISSILLEEKPQQIFIPYSGDKQAEHQATYKIVQTAYRACGLPTEIYEYPIWFWNHWPWVGMPSKVGRRLFKFVMASLGFGLGLRLWRDFHFGVHLNEVIERKNAALAQYQTQMTKYVPDVSWPILPEISNGEFLAWFSQEYEIFCRTD